MLIHVSALTSPESQAGLRYVGRLVSWILLFTPEMSRQIKFVKSNQKPQIKFVKSNQKPQIKFVKSILLLLL